MTFLDRSQIDRVADRAPPAPGKELMIGILLTALYTLRSPARLAQAVSEDAS